MRAKQALTRPEEPKGLLSIFKRKSYLDALEAWSAEERRLDALEREREERLRAEIERINKVLRVEREKESASMSAEMKVTLAKALDGIEVTDSEVHANPTRHTAFGVGAELKTI